MVKVICAEYTGSAEREAIYSDQKGKEITFDWGPGE